MPQKYEYKFVRLSIGLLGLRWPLQIQYRQLIQEHARDGWRLVQIFAPVTGGYGLLKYFEIIFEREIET